MGTPSHWFFSRPDIHRNAMWEVAYLTGVGLVALFFAPIFAYAKDAFANHPPPTIYMYDAIGKGQLFPFSFSTAGALVWLQTRDYGGQKRIPFKSALTAIIGVCSFAAVGFYSLSLDSVTYPFWIVAVSITVVVIFVALRYVLVVGRDMPLEDVQAGLQLASSRVISRAEQRRGKKQNGDEGLK